MSITEIITIFSALISLAGFIWLSASKISRLELKVDTIWDFFMTKAKTDALSSGIATQNSPIKIKEEARKWVAASIDPELDASLRELYKNHKKISDNDLALKIQQTFGERIAKEMCIPNDDLNYETCLLIAIELAKDDD